VIWSIGSPLSLKSLVNLPMLGGSRQKDKSMKTLEQKIRESLREGTPVGRQMQPLARQILKRIVTRPADSKGRVPGA